LGADKASHPGLWGVQHLLYAMAFKKWAEGIDINYR